MSKKRVAIVGSGISGLSCGWVASLSDEIEVTLYEKNPKLGGHSNTIQITKTDQKLESDILVDTGFIVYNELNYPNLVKMFEKISVETQASDMSFALSVEDGNLEWAGQSLGTVFAQKKNFFSISFWRMILDIIYFGKDAFHVLDEANSHIYDEMELGEYLTLRGYSESFKTNYILPMTSAIWSTPMKGMLQFPIKTLLQFMHNHKLLQIFDRPTWRTVKNGSQQYVKKLEEEMLKNGVRIQTDCPVKSVKRAQSSSSKISVTTSFGTEEYDQVVFACHADEVLAILQDTTEEESEILRCFPYKKNIAYLHSDEKLMPKLKSIWASWNYLMKQKDTNDSSDVVLTYWMNRLQQFLPSSFPLFVTLNPSEKPDSAKTFKEIEYWHPVYTPASTKAQKKLDLIQGKNGTFYCGAYCGFGFHEDGLVSGLKIAEMLGSKCPWEIDIQRYTTAPTHQGDSFPLLVILSFGLVLFLVLVQYLVATFHSFQ